MLVSHTLLAEAIDVNPLFSFEAHSCRMNTYTNALSMPAGAQLLGRIAAMLEEVSRVFRFEDKGDDGDRKDEEKKGFDKLAHNLKEKEDASAHNLHEKMDARAKALSGGDKDEGKDKDKKDEDK
jgi:hypothetical protein